MSDPPVEPPEGVKVEPLTESEYEPIRAALFDSSPGQGAEAAKRKIAQNLNAAGYRIVRKTNNTSRPDPERLKIVRVREKRRGPWEAVQITSHNLDAVIEWANGELEMTASAREWWIPGDWFVKWGGDRHLSDGEFQQLLEIVVP